MLPGRKSARISAGFSSGKHQHRPPTGLRPAGGPILRPARIESGRDPARKLDFRPGMRTSVELSDSVLSGKACKLWETVWAYYGHSNSHMIDFFIFRGPGGPGGGRNRPPGPPPGPPRPARNVIFYRSGVGDHSGAPAGAQKITSKIAHCFCARQKIKRQSLRHFAVPVCAKSTDHLRMSRKN